MADEYGDCHRFFLQEMMTVGILNSYQVNKLHEDSCKAFNQESDRSSLLAFIKSIKTKIQPLGMSIKKWIDEDDWKKGRGKSTFYVLTCTTERSCAEFPILANKAMPDFAPREVEFLRLIMKRILLSDESDKQIRRQEALNLTLELSGPNRMSMADAEKSIMMFRARKWIKFCPRDENIRLSARFLAEMQSYLLNLFNKAQEADDDEEHPGSGVNFCPAPGCNQLVIRGYPCDSCKGIFHLYCVSDQDGTGQESRGTCPKCRARVHLRDSSKGTSTKGRKSGGGAGSSSTQSQSTQHSRRSSHQEPVKRKRISQLASSSEDEGGQQEEMEY